MGLKKEHTQNIEDFFEIDCRPMRARISKKACIQNQEMGVIACNGCPKKNSKIKPRKKKRGDHFRGNGLYLKNQEGGEKVETKKETKVCKKCGKEKLIDEFPVNHKCQDGHLNTCRSCMNKLMKQGHQKRKTINTNNYLSLDIDVWSSDIRESLKDAAELNIRTIEEQAIAYIVLGLKGDGYGKEITDQNA